MKRVIMHWSAGGHYASDNDRKHYHAITQANGSRVLGYLQPEANEDTRDGVYAAHTRALNTGSIGLAMAAMRDAKERPFDWGDAPITPTQLDAFCAMVAEYCETYKIKVTRQTVLTHAEVEPTLKVKQRGKWDITVLPGMKKPADPVEVGDHLRKLVKQKMKSDWQRKPQFSLGQFFASLARVFVR